MFGYNINIENRKVFIIESLHNIVNEKVVK